jgi:CHASE3 domain sensor protein
MKKFMKIRLSTWFVLALAMMMGVTVVVIKTFERLDAQGKVVLHSRNTANTINDVQIAASDINSSERDYVITGQFSRPNDYVSAIAIISQKSADLVKLVEDNPIQHQRAELLRTAVSEKVKIAKEIVAAREKNGFPTALASMVNGNKDEEAVDDQIRVLSTQMRADEDRLIEMRRGIALNTRNEAFWFSSFGMFLGVAIIILVFSAVRRENRRRFAAEQKVVLISQRLAMSLHQAEQLMDEKNLIDELDDKLRSCLTVEEAQEVIGKEMPRILSGLRGAIYLYQPSRNHLEMAANWNTPSVLTQEKSFAPENCWALTRRALHLMRNSHTDIACAHIHVETVESSICTPMVVHGEMIGLLYIEAKRSQLHGPIVDFTNRVAEQIGMSLATLQLQQSLRSQSSNDAPAELLNDVIGSNSA